MRGIGLKIEGGAFRYRRGLNPLNATMSLVGKVIKFANIKPE